MKNSKKRDGQTDYACGAMRIDRRRRFLLPWVSSDMLLLLLLLRVLLLLAVSFGSFSTAAHRPRTWPASIVVCPVFRLSVCPFNCTPYFIMPAACLLLLLLAAALLTCSPSIHYHP